MIGLHVGNKKRVSLLIRNQRVRDAACGAIRHQAVTRPRFAAGGGPFV